LTLPTISAVGIGCALALKFIEFRVDAGKHGFTVRKSALPRGRQPLGDFLPDGLAVFQRQRHVVIGQAKLARSR